MTVIRNTSAKAGNSLFHYILPALLCSAFLCTGGAFAASSEVVDRIVAVVNDDIVVLQEINKLLDPLQTQIRTAGYSADKMDTLLYQSRQEIINQLIDQKLINQAAKEYQLSVTEEEVDAAVERIKEANRFTDEQFREALTNEGVTMDSLRSQLKEQILASKLENIEVRSKIVITREDVSAYYNAHADQYKGEKTYHLRNILIKAPQGDTPSEKAAVEQKLALIQSELAAGKSFEDLAKRYSESPYAEDGGELGKFKLSDLSENLKAAIEPLSAGQTTPVLETSEGYQIIYLQEVIDPADTGLDSVYSEIENTLYQEAYKAKRQEWTERLRKEAHIKIIQ